MADIRITTSGPKTLYFTLADFAAKANVIYPQNTIIWLKGSDGICKIANGVTQLGNLPFKQINDILDRNFLYNVNGILSTQPNFRPPSSHEGVFSVGGGAILNANLSANVVTGVLLYIPYEMRVDSIGIVKPAVNSANIDIKFALYDWNMTTQRVENKLTPDFQFTIFSGASAGRYYFSIAPINLSPGYYFIAQNQNNTLPMAFYQMFKYSIINNSVSAIPVYKYQQSLAFANPLPNPPFTFNLGAFTSTPYINLYFLRFTLNV